MNIDIKKLKGLRTSLENDYNKVEEDINLFLEKEQDTSDLIKKQDMIDEQLDLIDMILNNMEETPKMHKELMSINEEYKKQAGE